MFIKAKSVIFKSDRLSLMSEFNKGFIYIRKFFIIVYMYIILISRMLERGNYVNITFNVQLTLLILSDYYLLFVL